MIEAGGVLAGGHSIADADVKYGLSVMGTVHPDQLYANNRGKSGDMLILTKKLGVGIICTANRVKEASQKAMDEAVRSMTTLNRYAAEICRKYPVHACTDVTGFGFLGHLHEMLDDRLSCVIDVEKIPYIEEARQYADDFLLSAAGQRNRNFVQDHVTFEQIPFAMEEILFDPQTSGGLLLAVDPALAAELEEELQKAGLPARIVGKFLEKQEQEIMVRSRKL